MYRDRTLVPTQAVRLDALGFLAEGPMRYSTLAGTVRQFISRTVGPSVELLGPSIELLRLEGLVDAADGAKTEDDPMLSPSKAGLLALSDLLQARVRGTDGDLNRLVVSLKLRFLDHLDPIERDGVIRGLVDAAERERERLVDLRDSVTAGGGLPGWLDLDLAQLDQRIDWLRQLA